MCEDSRLGDYCDRLARRPNLAKKPPTWLDSGKDVGTFGVSAKPPSWLDSGKDMRTFESSCCQRCSGSAFCSPVSGKCYDWKRKDYYHVCKGCDGTQPMADDGNFTIVFIPDTQFYVMDTGWSGAYQWEWMAQAQWIAEQQQALNIKAVIHVGDLVEKADRPHEWKNFFVGWEKIEATGVAWSLVPGNHDLKDMRSPWAADRWDQYNAAVAPAFQRNPHLHSNFPEGSYENSVVVFEASGIEFMVLGLELGPTKETMEWAENQLLQNPQKNAIINIHFVRWQLHAASDVSEWAKQFRNVFLIHQGHDCAREWHNTILNDWGEPILEVLTDYQCSGDGHLRYYTFRLNSGEVDAFTYSPSLQCYERDQNSQFTFGFQSRW
eukprot:TRINITY_DN3243_c0_g1_i4.p1 TRINITY_DN3243_c0_g1~~TRINITY_DN3243_c0_g1_i4.p1  ORF type:complete len:379 (-),score=47.45 TRINITY_DN3243_c0_g1_i4:388-1524(-)